MNIYNACPTIENDKYIIRLFDNSDCDEYFHYSLENAGFEKFYVE